jgi:hypothetical protein
LKNDGAFLGCMFGGDTLFEFSIVYPALFNKLPKSLTCVNGDICGANPCNEISIIKCVFVSMLTIVSK